MRVKRQSVRRRIFPAFFKKKISIRDELMGNIMFMCWKSSTWRSGVEF